MKMDGSTNYTSVFERVDLCFQELPATRRLKTIIGKAYLLANNFSCLRSISCSSFFDNLAQSVFSSIVELNLSLCQVDWIAIDFHPLKRL